MTNDYTLELILRNLEQALKKMDEADKRIRAIMDTLDELEHADEHGRDERKASQGE